MDKCDICGYESDTAVGFCTDGLRRCLLCFNRLEGAEWSEKQDPEEVERLKGSAEWALKNQLNQIFSSPSYKR